MTRRGISPPSIVAPPPPPLPTPPPPPLAPLSRPPKLLLRLLLSTRLALRNSRDDVARALISGASLCALHFRGKRDTSDPAMKMQPPTNHMGPSKLPVAVEMAPMT